MTLSDPQRPPRFAQFIAVILELAALLLIELVFISLIPPTPQLASSITDHIDTTPLMRILFDTDIRQAGLEHERLSGVILPARIALEQFGHIPTWNPYIATGEPLINNAFSYLFNPFHSLPILLYGGVEGSKLATFIALLIAAYSMWAFGRALGLGGVARVTMAALYMMSGGIMGKFYAGHFQLGLSLVWPPLVFAALWWTLHSRSRLAPITFGIAFALLFFAGNIYYVLHTLLCAFLIVVVHLIERNASRWQIRWDRLRRVTIAGAFAFGLAALQFFPVWQTRDYVDHPAEVINGDGSLQGSYDMGQAVANLTYPWGSWINFEVLSNPQQPAVDYAYIGAAPFLLILLGMAVLFAYAYRASLLLRERYPNLRPQYIGVFLLLAVLMMIWGAGQTSILQWLYTHISLLAEFRFLGRALAIAALWWIVLAGIALDLLWKAAADAFGASAVFAAYDRVRLLRAMGIAVLIWAYFLIYSIGNASTRQTMVFDNFRLLNALDSHRFTSFSQAANALLALILIGVLADTVLLILERLIRPRLAQSYDLKWRAVATRAVHILLLAVAAMGILDIMTVNSALFEFDLVGPRFTAIYADIKQMDSNPVPSVNDPFSPLTFDDYENGIRSWGLNEGWTPFAMLGVIPTLDTLTDLPRWVIVSNVYGGEARDYGQMFVEKFGYQQRKCYPISSTGGTSDDPCLMDFQHVGAVLYEKPDALPYAFIARGIDLLNNPESINTSNIFPAQVLSDQMDSLTIQAVTPIGDMDWSDYLIVEETNFPGWEAAIDGVPAPVTTAQTAFDGIQNRGFVTILMPAGTHTYSLHFVPPGLNTGLLFFFITWIAIGLYLFAPSIIRLYQTKRRPKPPELNTNDNSS